MGLFDWLRGKPKPEHEYTDRIARWMHKEIETREKAGDALAIAEAAAAFSGRGMMAFGMLVTDFGERDEVREEALAALQRMMPTVPEHSFESVQAVIQHAKLPIEYQARQSKRAEAKQRAVDAMSAQLRAAIDGAGTAELIQGYVALRNNYHDAFRITVPPAMRAEMTERARARVIGLLPFLTDDECDELLPMIDSPPLEIDVSARRNELREKRRQARDSAIASAIAGEPRNVELEAAIAADFDDVAAYSVYADFLGDHGHPRGELIELALRAEQDAALVGEVERLITERADVFLGPLAPYTKRVDYSGDAAFTWRRGFIDRAVLTYDENCREKGQPRTSLVELLRVLVEHPSGRFLRALALGINGLGSETTLDDVIAALVGAPPPHLSELVLGEFTHDQSEMSWYQVGNVAPIWPALPQLHKLVVRGGSFELGTIVAPALEHAEFHTGGLSRANLEAIIGASWPKLRHLDVWFGDADYGAETELADVQPLLARKDLPALVHLGLCNCEYTDGLCAILAGSPLAKQIESLDLSRGTLGAEGVQALVAAKSALPKLAKLDVADNFLVAADIALLRGAFPFVHVGEQRDEANLGGRIVSVGE